MRLSRRKLLQLGAASTALAAVPRPAAAEGYPTRPITVIVPFAAGGPVDTLARVITQRLHEILGQPIVVENVTGAAGSIGVGRVARAAPDGYTLVFGIWSTHVVNAVVYDLGYDVVSDFTPVALMADNALIVIGRKTLPADDLRGFIAWLQANPGRALAGTSGVGSPQHVFALLLQQQTGTQFGFIHYRGGALAIGDLLGERIDFIVSDQVTALPQIRAGTVKAYGVTASNRLAVAADIPTVDEAGLPTFHVSVWNAIWAPKNTPAAVIARLNAAIVEASSDPQLRKRLLELGQTIVPRDRQTPDALAALQKAEIAKWWPIIKAAGIRAN
jgi:tripartite-type tricarboxylate transporter receptor subunit TctC